jgi:ribosomal protein L31
LARRADSGTGRTGPDQTETKEVKEMTRKLRPTLAALFAMTLFLAACGSSTDTEEETQAAADSAGQTGDDAANDDSGIEDASMDDMDDMDGGHDHGTVLEVPDGMAVPSLSVEAAVDPVAGVNLFVELADFTIAPESASTEPIDGEGHLHLYIDGERVKRFYNTELHLADIEPGEREIMVEISSNNHSPYAVDGVAIQQATTITVPEVESDGEHGSHGDSQGDMHSDMHGGELVESANPPAVELTITKDPKSGWNVFADVSGLTFAADAAGLDNVDGEGHLHLYVDGKKVERLYGPWTHIGSLEAGTREVSVEVNANSHAAYDDGSGNPVMAMTTIEVSEADASTMAHSHGDDDHGDDDSHDDQAMKDDDDGGHSHGDDHGHGHHGTGEMLDIDPADADVVVNASFTGGDVEVESRRVQVEEGQTVGITFTSDAVEQIHVHGYDLLADIGPDTVGEIAFLADSKGTYEVELESSGRFLFEIQVS